MWNNNQEKALSQVHSYDTRHYLQPWEASYLWRSHVPSQASFSKVGDFKISGLLILYHSHTRMIITVFFFSGGGNWRDWCRLGRYFFCRCNGKRKSACPNWRTKEKLYKSNYLLTLLLLFSVKYKHYSFESVTFSGGFFIFLLLQSLPWNIYS